MTRPAIEVADIFRHSGPAWRNANAGHVSLDQLKVMSAIETCRTAVMGGHVDACEDCGHLQIAYNSCRNRCCPKCQSIAAKEWLAGREAELLPVPYFHLVFSLPRKIADIAFQNRAVVCDMLFKGSSETLTIIAADPKHLGAKIGMTAVLHSWGSAMTWHPHVHIIVPGGGISLDGQNWVTGRPRFFLSVKVLSRLFRDHGSVLWCAPKHTKWLPKSPLHSFLAIKNTAKLRCCHVQLGWMLISEIAKSP